MFRRFLASQRGSIAPIFAIALLPMVAATGAAVDYARAFQLRTAVQTALDAAALAANRKIGVLDEAGIRAEAEAFYQANLAGKFGTIPAFTMNLDDGGVLLDTDLSVPTSFLGVIGFDTIEFDIKSKTVAGAATYEVVMVLDNSGSMRGSKISTLRTAAKDLVDILFEVNKLNPKQDPVKIGLVPFAASVNVGSKYASASWMDRNGLSPIHHEDFEDKSKTRWDLFNALRYTSWAGCVQTRPMPYDVSDAAPSTGKPETLFVPMFAVDEADRGAFSNDYVDDDEGSCSRYTPSTDNSESSQKAAQARLCKYDGERPSYIRPGPNWNCTTQAVQPLTATKSTIDNQIDNMDADGMTNIHGGIMWGWRLLSAGEPFTEGRAYGEKDNRKILIVMTDGANTYTTTNNFNKSMYGAFGYVSHGHLGTTSSSNRTVVEKMDERTKAACTAVKATGNITVYTIAFQVNDSDTIAMLEGCASQKEMAFTSRDNGQLVEIFQKIASDISLLRVAE